MSPGDWLVAWALVSLAVGLLGLLWLHWDDRRRG